MSEQRIVGASPAFSSSAVIGAAVASTAQPRELPQAVTLPAPPPAAAPLEPATALRAIERALDRDEIANLIKRGQELATQGDIAGARLLLRRAAEAGDAQAMQALGATYDPHRGAGQTQGDRRCTRRRPCARLVRARSRRGSARSFFYQIVLEQLAGRTQ